MFKHVIARIARGRGEDSADLRGFNSPPWPRILVVGMNLVVRQVELTITSMSTSIDTRARYKAVVNDCEAAFTRYPFSSARSYSYIVKDGRLGVKSDKSHISRVDIPCQAGHLVCAPIELTGFRPGESIRSMTSLGFDPEGSQEFRRRSVRRRGW